MRGALKVSGKVSLLRHCRITRLFSLLLAINEVADHDRIVFEHWLANDLAADVERLKLAIA